MAIFIGVIVYCLIFGFACRYLAKEKNKDETTWFIIGFFLGIIGLLVIGFSGSNSQIKNIEQSKSYLNNQFIRKDKFSLNKVLFGDNILLNKRYQEYGNNELNNIKRVAGYGAVCYPEQRETTWICVCGSINELADEECKRCKRNKDEVLKI